MSRILVLSCAVLAAVPLFAHAEECRFQAPRNLDLDLRGVSSVSVITNQHDVHVRGIDGAGGAVRGRACASKQDVLDRLQVTQRREGSKLVIEARTVDEGIGFHLFGSNYAYIDIGVAIPKSLPVDLNVGSGDANVDNVAALDAHVGSGDLDVSNIAGRVTANVGSGDIKLRNIGDLQIDSVGSGDLEAANIRGDARVGSVGSGDATLRQVGGSVAVDSIGSGDLDVDGVGRDLHVRSVGSGDISHRNVTGTVDVPRDDD